ncbi:hypothetical protein LSTR_LSTR016465 [Laodelphax striatellus]|uniref:Uncharacterized protein n=1 Tax=Laodelphax striatellus TaxID=195883 RepID=A0A482WIJ6_LAOST|nr:hypothetical protein LSTR_LSTR016465 [Laodelphax striatellus]
MPKEVLAPGPAAAAVAAGRRAAAPAPSGVSNGSGGGQPMAQRRVRALEERVLAIHALAAARCSFCNRRCCCNCVCSHRRSRLAVLALRFGGRNAGCC